MYCLICKKHKLTNQQNKSDIFNEKPSIRYKTTAILENAEFFVEKHDSANATAMFQTIQSNLQACTLSTDKLIGLATDGASVMVGRKNGLAAKLKDVNPRLISVHCICHILALACTDAKDDANLKLKRLKQW